MSVGAFNDFISFITQEDSLPASKSSPSIAKIIGDFDQNLEGEAKGIAIMHQLAKAAESKGYNVDFDDVVEYMRNLKTRYETDTVFAAIMDSYCSTTCHLASVVGKA